MCLERGRSGDNPAGGKVCAVREGGQETILLVVRYVL